MGEIVPGRFVAPFLAATVFFVFAVVAIGGAAAGTRAYDIGGLLFERHPFASDAPLRPVVASPVPPDRIRPLTRIPRSSTPSRPVDRPAAERLAAQRLPPATAQRTTPPPAAASRPGLGGLLSEVRVGLLAHDNGPFTSHEESGFDGNFELLFVSPDILDVVWSPRPHLGLTVNSDGNTSQVYAGLSWEGSFWGNWFAGFSFGGSLHDGETRTNLIERKELGCRLLFRGSVELGYRFRGRHAISGFLEHISNAKLCGKNEGLESAGIRYGYSF